MGIGKVFSTPQVAAIFGVGEKEILAWVRSGALESHQTPGKKKRYTEAALRNFIRADQNRAYAIEALEAALRAKSEAPGLGLRKPKVTPTPPDESSPAPEDD